MNVGGPGRGWAAAPRGKGGRDVLWDVKYGNGEKMHFTFTLMENTNYTWILAYETLCDLVAWYEHAYSSCVYLNINYKNEKKVQILEILSNTFVYSGNCVRGNYA